MLHRQWEEQDSLRRAVRELPVVLSHNDAHVQNLFPTPHGIAAIDWELVGTGPLGTDIAYLLIASLRRCEFPIAKAGDLAALLTNLQARDVLFIDEIHRLNPAVEEILYPAMGIFSST